MKTIINNEAGFTLVEIMIVVAIIGILATLAIPNYVKAREQTSRTACITNLQHIDGAVQLWAMENKKDTDQSVTYSDISGYLRNSVVCPAGGTTFADSYTLNTVESKPTCQRKPQSHLLSR
jgi:prepilin-type N-terminal cleavage/methylation domain-containing protein